MIKQKLILVGGGGHCKGCIDIIEQTGEYEIIGILDLAELLGTNVLNYQVIGTDHDIAKFVALGYHFLITVGQIKSPVLKSKLFDRLLEHEANIATIIAASAQVSKYSKIGIGTIVMQQAIVNAGVVIGDNCILNNKCDVEHDTIVGNHTHISTGAIVNGDCIIGNGVFIGSNANIGNQITIVDQVIVGAGSVVIRNIEAKDIQAGNPAKSIVK